MSFQNPWFHAAKAGFATLLALLLCELLGNPDKVSATFVAVLCCSPSVSIGMVQGFQQLGASLLGGGFGLVCVLLGLSLTSGVPLAVGCAVLLTSLMGFKHGIGVAAFTALFVQIVPFGTPMETWWTRQEAVLIALTSAALVNIVVSAGFYRSIFNQRLARVRTFIDFRLAEALRDPFAVEPGFRVLGEVREEIQRARHELQLRRALATDAHLARVEAEVDRLKRVLHEVYALGMRLEDHPELNASHTEPLIAWVRMPEGEPPEVPEPLSYTAARLVRVVERPELKPMAAE